VEPPRPMPPNRVSTDASEPAPLQRIVHARA
jgi:hypothetical protein